MRIFDADVTGSLNVSGSSDLKGGLTVSGSQTVTGSLTVHGNAKLGDQLTDTHTVTGSLRVTGSLSGSLTGSLRTDYIDVNTGSTATGAVGRLVWNADEMTLDIGMGGGNVTQQVGQELYYPPVFNGDSIDLINGTLVMVNPADVSHGDRLAVIRSVADGSVPSKLFVGILTEDINQNEIGFATWFGLVRGLSVPDLVTANLKDTNELWVDGTLLYASPTRPGGLTSVEPTAPNLKVIVAAVTRQYGNNVDIMVRPDLNKFLGELNDVTFDTLTNSNLIVRSGSQWVNSNTLSGSYVISGSLDVVGTQTINGNQIISGSISITENIIVYGTSSFLYVTSSNLNLTGPYIYTNVYEPVERFGGLVVFDSGSESHLATASLLWDSTNNHWIYQNASGSSYSGGMLLSGPRNTGSLGEELGLTYGRLAKSVGGDHLDNSNITDNGSKVSINSNTEITGSLKVTGGISGLIDYSFVTNVPAFITGYTETQTLQDVTDLGSITSNDITANSFIVTGGASDQFLKGDGTLDNNSYLTAHPSVTAASSSNNSGRTYIQDILLDQFGHITGITTATETVVNADTYLTGATFNTGTGVITLTKNDGNTVTVDIDGRFLTSYTETQTLQDVTDLGSTTTNDITAHSFIVTGANGSQFLKGDGTLDGTTYLTSASLNGYATTGYVSTQISNLIDSAPGTLDTLNELAAAINDDPNFYGTITGITNGKVSKSGDTMTGDLTIQKNSPLFTLGQANVSTGTTTIQMYAGGSGTFNGYSISYHKDTGIDQLEFIDGGGVARIFFENGGTLNAAAIKKIGGLSTQFLKADGSVDTNTYLTAHPSVSAASSSDNSGRTYIQDILLDQYGHITGITTASETLVNTDNYTTGVTFNTSDGVVTFTRNDGGTYTVDLDGRYLTAHPSVSAATSSNNSGRTYIQDILVDSFGHITGITTATETVVDTNDFINNVQLVGTTLRFTGSGGSAFTGDIDLSSFLDDTNNYTTGVTFNTGDGVLTFTRNDGNTYTVDLDGRYLTSFSETDTLATVTARGNTTTTSITVSGLTSNNDVNISGGTLTVYDNVSGSTVFAVDGTNGRLFAVTDDLSNSLFSVNTISGLPVIEAFADYHIVMGRFNQNDFYLGTTGEIGMGIAPVSGYKLAVNGNVRATSFVKSGGTSSQFLKADGSVDSSTYLTAHPSVSASSSSNNSGRTYIQDILLDSFGHITGITTATETVVDTDTITRVGTSGNEVSGTVTFAGAGVTTVTQVGSTVTISTAAGANTYLTGATFNTGDGVITLTKNDGNTVTVDIDGRFLTAESDTLATVTARGASTTTAVSFNGGLTTTGLTNNSSAIIANSTAINPDTNSLTVVAGGITQTGWGVTSGIGGKGSGVGDTWAIGHNNNNLYFGIGDGASGNSLRTFLEVTPGRQLTLPSLATAGFVKTNASGVLSIDTTTYLTTHPSVTAASSVNNGGRTYIQDILLDQYGHITGITSATETVVNTDTNYYTTGATFNTGNGVITLTRNDGGTVTVDIDGRFSALGHTHDDRYLPYEATSDVAKNTGWYTIAVNPGNRAMGKFILRDTSSGNHQAVVFYASHFYGNYSDITVLINSYYGGSPFRSIRIVDGGTYDGALLQVQIDLDAAQVKAWLLEDIQDQGWIIKDWIDDGVDPGDVNSFAQLTTTPVQVDLDNAAPGGIITTGNIYGGGDGTQYLYLNTNNYSTTLDGRYYTETEIGNFFGGTTAITGYNKSNWDTAYGWGNHAVQGYATTGYVSTQISNLIDSAPGTLDTLNELAAAINDDPNFYSTITGITNNKVSKSGDTMTGDLVIGTAASSASTQAFGDFTQLLFDNSHSDTNRGPNKIVMHNNGSTWIGGFGIHSDTVSYYTGGAHRWYKTTSQTASTLIMTLDGSGNLSVGGNITGSTFYGALVGNASTVTNGVYTTGTYSNPSWITALAGSKITGNIGGSAYNITQYTINQNLGTGDTPSFSVVTASRFQATASGTRNKFALWGTDANYTIGMQDGYTYGGLNNDYAMTFQMNNDSDRGFWWGDASHNTTQGAMSLTTDGNLTVARRIRVGYGESDTTIPNVPLQVYGSGSLVFDVQGSQGQLFSVTDNLSGSLFSVNDISGLPILEVNSDDSVTMGRYNQNDFVLDTNGNMGMGTVPVSGTKLKVSGNVNATKVSIGSANYSYDLYNNGTTYLNGSLTMDDIIYLTDAGYFVGSPSYGFRFNNNANNANNMSITDAGNVYVRGNVYVGGNGSSTGDIVATQAWVSGQGYITGYVNLYTTGATFNTGNGIITFTRNNGDTYTVDIDGRFLTSYTETDTLATVTARGASTTTDLTLSGRVTFNSAVVDRPQMPGGFLGIDTGDSDFDIWGISRDYYPSHTTAANAWGLEWYGTGNQFRFVGNGTRVITLDMDNGNIATTGTLSASGYNNSNWDTAYGWGNHASVGYITGYTETDTLSSVVGRGNSTTSEIIVGAVTVQGSLSRGTYTAGSNYKTGADNIVLKGNSSGVSGIFFESEKDGTNINHPSDFGFIQFHPYGIGGTSGESNRFVIGVSNDSDDYIVLNPVSSNGLVVRVGSGTTEYVVYHAGNIPTWNQNTTGNAATATTAGFADEAKWISFPDGPRDLSDRRPNWNNRSVAWDFVNAASANGTGNYGGVMTFSPWDGTTASTGDSSYQLAFGNASGVNASGQPKLSIRNGIDTTWNSWYTIIHSGNIGSYTSAHIAVTGASSVNNSGRTYIQDILMDQYGHITGITSATETVVNTDTNYYTTGATFNTSNGIITGTRNDGGTWTVDIDGRFLTAESDTLATVTARGASTSTTLSLAKVITTGLYGPGGTGNIPIWQYDSSNTGYGIVYNEGSPDTLRIDVSGNAVSGTPDVLIGPDYIQVNGNTVYHTGNIPTWNQSTTGNAATVTINYSNDSNSTYQMLWGSGNSVYGTGGVYLNPSTDYVYAASFNASDWFRSSGATGWYNSTYGGGWYMTDTSYLRPYNGKSIHMGNASIDYVTQLHFNDNVRFYDEGNNQYLVYKWGNSGAGGIKFVDGDTSLQGYVYGSGDGSFGLLDSSGNWKVRVDTSNVEMYGTQYLTTVYAYTIYDRDDNNYYLNPAGLSRVYGLTIRGEASASDSVNQIFFWANDTTTSAIGFKSNAGEFTNPTGNGDGYNTYFTMDTDGRGWVFRRGSGSSNFNAAYTAGWILNNGIWQASASMRAPIFYDSNDTNYYLDPNSASNLKTLTLNSSGAGAEVLAINGTNGRLFTVTDDMTDSIFSVNTISGLPVIEAFADYKVVMGRYGLNDLHITNGGDVVIGGDTPISTSKFSVIAGGANGVSWGSGISLGSTSSYTSWIQDANISRWRNTGGGGYEWYNSTAGTKLFDINNDGSGTIAGAFTAGGNITGAYILGSYFNSSAGNSENPTIGQIWTQNTSDNYLRKSTPSHFISSLSITRKAYTQFTGVSSFTYTHNLDVDWPVVQLIEDGSNEVFFPRLIRIVDTNTVYVEFTTNRSGTIVVVG